MRRPLILHRIQVYILRRDYRKGASSLGDSLMVFGNTWHYQVSILADLRLKRCPGQPFLCLGVPEVQVFSLKFNTKFSLKFNLKSSLKSSLEFSLKFRAEMAKPRSVFVLLTREPVRSTAKRECWCATLNRPFSMLQ